MSSRQFRFSVLLVVLFAVTQMGGAQNGGLQLGRSSRTPRDEGIRAFTEPWKDVAVAAAEMGLLQKLHVREGDHVNAGDVLAVLDDRVLQASVKVAEAARDARGQYLASKEDVRFREADLEKRLGLLKRGNAGQAEVDRAQSEFAMAEARLQAAEEELLMKEREYERLQAQLAKNRVISPIDGTVVEVVREPGEFVSPSDAQIIRVVQLDPLQIIFSVPLDKRDAVRAGDSARILIGSEKSEAVGTVEFVSPVADESNSSIRVRIRLPNADGQWHAGENCELVLGESSASRSELAANRKEK